MTDDPALHLDALERARRVLATTDEPAGEDVTVVPRCHPPEEGRPTALLAAFTGDHLLIYPLWPGINRVGARAPLSDYEQPPRRWLEARQWLLLVHGTRAFVVDDRTTNQSCVLPADAPRIASVVDRRFERSPLMPREVFDDPAVTRLDWHGTVSAELTEGSTLFSAYAGFVFGWL